MGTKKGNRRKGAVRGARLAYDAVPKKKKKKKARGPRRTLADQLRDIIPDIFENRDFAEDQTLFEYWTGVDYKTTKRRKK